MHPLWLTSNAQVLELAEDEELEDLYRLLHGGDNGEPQLCLGLPAAAPAACLCGACSGFGSTPAPLRPGSHPWLPHLPAGRSFFSPLVKSIVAEREDVSAALHGRDLLMQRIDQRLRFLAADSASTLKGRWPDYR